MRTGYAAKTLVVLIALAAATPRPVLATDEEIFSDGFESGDFSAWSAVVGALPTPTVHRFADLDLRDPHLFVEFTPLCLDFTDDPLPVFGIAFNGTLADALTGDEDMDGLLDLSPLLLFRPIDPLATDLRLDQVDGLCTAPVETTVCTANPLVEPVVGSYDGQGAGVCLEAIAGTTSGYTPPIVEPAGPCFTSNAADVTLALGDLQVPLQDAQVAGRWVGDPVTAITDGLIRGFLTEATADALLLPADLPLVGGQPLSVLLPGGTGNCAPGDDRDLHEGVMGWWFYLRFTAAEVEFLGT